MADICRIEKLQNGFEVKLYDPKIAAENSKPRSRYRDPWVGYACKSVEEVVALLKTGLDKASPADEYSSTFDALVASNEDDED